MGFRAAARLRSIETVSLLQRLFSTFPDGLPGFGLLLLRFGAAGPLVYSGAVGVPGDAGSWSGLASHTLAIAGGVLLLIGLWTPIAGTLLALDQLWSAVSSQPPALRDPWVHVLLAVLAAGVAMLGPGAYSADARLFGRKRIEFDRGGRHH